MKRENWIFVSVVFLAVAMVGCDKNDDNNNDNTDNTAFNQNDSAFILNASMSNFAEISAGQAAAERGNDTTVSNFGNRMVTEHILAGQQLDSVLAGSGLTTKDSLDQAHLMLMDSLQTLTGIQFDTVYINSQIRDHQMAISLFQNEASNGNNDKLKSFANDMLPHLNDHLENAQSIADRLRQQ
jgi:putative membrane protein